MHTKSYLEPVNNVYKERIRGVFFVSTVDKKRANFHFGCWSTQCSHEPPMMLTCFPKEIEGYEIVRRSGVWALSLVSEDQNELHDRFFYEGAQDIQSMGEDEFIYGKTGCPILKNATGYFECELLNFMDSGDFGIAMGPVVAAEILHPEKQNLTVNSMINRGFLNKRSEIRMPFTGFDVL